MDIVDYFNKIQDSMVKSFNKSFSKLNKSVSSDFKKPSCEISQGRDYFAVKFELPGMIKKDVSLHVTPDYLEVIAEKERKIKKNNKKEQSFVSYKRVVSLPPGLITDKINAKFNKEKLMIKIPKIKTGKVKIK